MSRPVLTRIANPLYDVVFRYLMEDEGAARLLLSALLGQEVVELTFNPTELSRKLGGEGSITVTRMDFNARVLQSDGSARVVLIELQKAKFHHQLMRFRRYLGKQYQNPQHVGSDEIPLPIYPVYILAEAFTEEVIPVIRVTRSYADAATEGPIATRHPFIEALTHDATVVQAQHLRGHRRTVLEQILSIFDQSSQADDKGHILVLDESAYPSSYRPLVRRLHKALQDEQLEAEMDLEDDILIEFNKRDEQLAAMRLQAEEAQLREEEARQQAEEARHEAEEARQRESQTLSAQHKLIRRLAALGMEVSDISADTGLSVEDILQILDAGE